MENQKLTVNTINAQNAKCYDKGVLTFDEMV